MGERKLATVRRISNIEPIPGADNIEKVTVDGWQLVSNKDNKFEIGHLVIYIEIDSFLPCIPQFEWMRDRCYKNTPNLGEGFIVKTIKLRGQLSQGLIVPLDDFLDKHDLSQYVSEGDDLTDFIGVKKYEKPIPAQLAGTVRGNFPSFIHKTDQERIQNNFGGIKNWILWDKAFVEHFTTEPFVEEDSQTVIEVNEGWLRKTRIRNAPEVIKARSQFEVTLKLDGSSMTVYYNNGEVGVCSRNMDLIRDPNNAFWSVAIKSGILDILAANNQNLAIQGELMGPGVQGNRENLPQLEMFVFDIFDIDQQRKLTPVERHDWYMRNCQSARIRHTPIINSCFNWTPETTVKDLLEIADKESSLNHPIAEGLVFKSYEVDGPSFKVISNKFLLKQKD